MFVFLKQSCVNVDAHSQLEEDKQEIKLQDSWSTVNQLTHHVKERQDLVKSLNSLKTSEILRQLAAQGQPTLSVGKYFCRVFLSSLGVPATIFQYTEFQ